MTETSVPLETCFGALFGDFPLSDFHVLCEKKTEGNDTATCVWGRFVGCASNWLWKELDLQAANARKLRVLLSFKSIVKDQISEVSPMGLTAVALPVNLASSSCLTRVRKMPWDLLAVLCQFPGIVQRV